ncbi:protein-glutamate O-methyltransferase CheR [Pelagicoccus albus]|uniref:protein-glutamate O-methyltransferase n=2 Tax=Pelagicoccus albus TaxID=415222 RepID=A0A7X1B757_9BACT|nr:CheR family methyltransferase [Pelagicoccus albus]MBC2606911.1 protein-glutamate O-methyltransferase CheR [Pelagicoccus albus]
MSQMGKISNQDYTYIRELVYKETRINLGDSKRELVSARLGKRLRAHSLGSYTEYCKMLQSNPNSGELYHLIDAISTNHTFFFREINHFNFLNSVILPQFANGQLGNKRDLKIWSCACSTGEEPYSLSIALEEYLSGIPSLDWKIQCSDISNRVLDFASKGIYEQERLKNVKPEWIKRYFQKGEKQMQGYYRVRPEISKKLGFQRLNLFAPQYPWNEKFQVIFCRNVMIYFDRETQQELVGRLARHLVPGGYLLIGHAESLAGIKHPYESIKPAIYQLPA